MWFKKKKNNKTRNEFRKNPQKQWLTPNIQGLCVESLPEDAVKTSLLNDKQGSNLFIYLLNFYLRKL